MQPAALYAMVVSSIRARRGGTRSGQFVSVNFDWGGFSRGYDQGQE